MSHGDTELPVACGRLGHRRTGRGSRLNALLLCRVSGFLQCRAMSSQRARGSGTDFGRWSWIIDEVLREALKHGIGGIHPDEEQLRTLVANNPDGPLEFVNPLSFYPEARYLEGHEFAERKMTGEEA